ncbi:hypothetical protein ACFSCW_10220 [Sphingomonas tabacisoli]|uniref:Uncharacterized protein n=1 Tax=Sphingomonas tabacisoli TaxID=2249466 RepID=A0ABW4I2L4_9SPHN
MLDDDALGQIAFLAAMAERRSSSVWARSIDAIAFEAVHPRRGNLLMPTAFAALFWALTYVIFTLRAFTIMTDAPLWSGIRFTATGIGALLVGLILAQIDEDTFARKVTVTRIVFAAICASVIVWTARNLYAAVAPEPISSVADNTRWAMFWAGYCVSFLSLYLLYLVKHRQASQMREAAIPAPVVTAREAVLSRLLDAFAEELEERGGEVDKNFLDRLERNLPLELVCPHGVTRDELNRSASEIFGRLHRKHPSHISDYGRMGMISNRP